MAPENIEEIVEEPMRIKPVTGYATAPQMTPKKPSLLEIGHTRGR